jgi:hypothetical protein
MVVVAARGIGLKPGTKIDAAQPLVLAEGQHVTLIAMNGVTLKLDGPYNRPPSASGGGSDLSAALKALVTQQEARTAEVGVTRSGTAIAKLPDPWLLDVSRTGNVCLLEGQPVVMWRPSSAETADLTVMPADRSWKAEATWPAGSERLLASPALEIHGDAIYLIAFDGGEDSAVTFNRVPRDLETVPMQAAWLAHQGCEAQAEALLQQPR